MANGATALAEAFGGLTKGVATGIQLNRDERRQQARDLLELKHLDLKERAGERQEKLFQLKKGEFEQDAARREREAIDRQRYSDSLLTTQQIDALNDYIINYGDAPSQISSAMDRFKRFKTEGTGDMLDRFKQFKLQGGDFIEDDSPEALAAKQALTVLLRTRSGPDDPVSEFRLAPDLESGKLVPVIATHMLDGTEKIQNIADLVQERAQAQQYLDANKDRFGDLLDKPSRIIGSFPTKSGSRAFVREDLSVEELDLNEQEIALLNSGQVLIKEIRGKLGETIGHDKFEIDRTGAIKKEFIPLTSGAVAAGLTAKELIERNRSRANN